MIEENGDSKEYARAFSTKLHICSVLVKSITKHISLLNSSFGPTTIINVIVDVASKS
jgi:hypothetical protein